MLETLSRLIARVPVHPALERVYLPLSQEGAISVVPLEASVTVGRTVGAQKRSGWIESQERLTEELAVGVTWLFGVRMMQHVFDQFIRKRLFPNHPHLRSETAWDVFGRLARQSVDLLPSERETVNAAERRILRRIQAARLSFSTLIATVSAALLIPVLNKKKTDWLIQALHHSQHQPQQPQQLPQQEFPPQQPLTTLIAPVQGNSVSPARSVSSAPAMAPILPTTQRAVPRFGRGFSALVQPIGHLVDQTAYGALLVIDLVLSSGRAYVYGKRSPLESVEIAFRDAASVYFYLFSTPHAVRFLAGLLNRVFKTSSVLTPPVADLLRREFLMRAVTFSPGLEKQILALAEAAAQNSPGDVALQQALRSRDWANILEATERFPSFKAALANLPIEAKTIRRVLHGHSDEMILTAQQALKQRMQQASRPAFQRQLAQLLATDNQLNRPRLLQAVKQAIGLEQHQVMTVSDIEQLLKQVQKGQGEFAGFSAEERENLASAIKRAFRNEVGERFGLENDHLQNYLKNKLGMNLADLDPLERSALLTRVRQAAHQDGLDIAAAQLQHQLNLLQTGSSDQRALARALRPLLSWVEASAIQGVSLQTQLTDEIQALRPALKKLESRFLVGKPDLPDLIDRALSGQENALLDLSAALEKAPGRRGRHFLDWLLERDSLETRIRRLQTILYPENALPDALARSLSSETLKQHSPILAAEQKLLALCKRLPDSGNLSDLLTGREGRLFSLATAYGAEDLHYKASGILKNGLVADNRLLTQAMSLRSQLPLSKHLFSRPKTAVRLRKQMTHWLNRLERYTLTQGNLASQPLSEVIGRTNQFARLGRNLHYPIWGISTLFSLWGLGILVPQVQMLITYILTGRYEHPGLKVQKPQPGYPSVPEVSANKAVGSA